MGNFVTLLTRDDHHSSIKPGVKNGRTSLCTSPLHTVIALWLPCRYPIVMSFSLYTRKDPSGDLLPTMTGMRIRREVRLSHPWVSPKLSLVSLHTEMRADAPLTSTAAVCRVDPGAGTRLYTRR